MSEIPRIIPGIHRLRLRLIEPDDAAYVHALRTNPEFNEYMSPVSGTVADQYKWIEKYKQREAAGCEYYYVIERLDDLAPCGLVRGFIDEGEVSWGSWMLGENKPAKAALESAVLIFRFAFEILKKPFLMSEALRGNARSVNFQNRMGFTVIGEDEQNFYFRYSREEFVSDQQALLKAIQA
ncbi:MAG: GNAT family N-acetyltransferase [Alphaproteobacteria bacterium]|nr:GNAT family N-acetyltransferase [Alphaproteobacteria bacterium]